MKNSFRYFKTSPEVIRLAVRLYVLFPLLLRNVEDLPHERGTRLSANENEAATLLRADGACRGKGQSLILGKFLVPAFGRATYNPAMG